MIRTLLLLLPAIAASGGVVVYPPAPGSVESDSFSLRVNGAPVRIEKVLQVHVAHFCFSGTAELVVTVPDRIVDYKISPVSYRILSDPHEKELTFTLTQPRKLVLYVNDYERLFIWADPIEENVPNPDEQGVVSVLDFGADPTGKNLCTEKIQEAIDRTPQGGTTFVPPGTYLTGGLFLKSDRTLYLCGGSLLQGSGQSKDFPPLEGFDGSNTQMISIADAENVAIQGRGAIDGNGAAIRAQDNRARLIRIHNSKNVLVEDVITRNAAAWNTHILHSERVTLRNVKQVNDMTVLNTDGFDPDSSSHVRIENCFALCNDDTVAIKTTGRMGLLRDVEDIVVRGNVFISQASALKVGTETRAGSMKNILFENNDVLECDRGMSLYVRDGAEVSDVRFIDNRFEKLFIDDFHKLLHFEIEERDGKGRIRNVLVKDCNALVPWPQPSEFVGLDFEHTISGVRIENLTIAGEAIERTEDIPLAVNEYVEYLAVEAGGSE